ncbi:MAG: NUDIX domain-containing protein [Candidatus Saccharimonadales bacterium]
MERIVTTILKLPDNKLVLQRRDNKAPSSPNLLTFFGGHREEGESALASAIRELYEETKLEFSEVQLTHIATITINQMLVDVFIANIDNVMTVVYEGLRAESYSVDELLLRKDLSPVAAIVLRNARKDKQWLLA